MDSQNDLKLEAMWVEEDAKRSAAIHEREASLQQQTHAQIEELLEAVRASLGEVEPVLFQNLDRIDSIAKRYRDGVNLWQEKAQTAIQNIGDKQRELAALVQATSLRCAERKVQFLEEQQRRADDMRQQCIQWSQKSCGATPAA